MVNYLAPTSHVFFFAIYSTDKTETLAQLNLITEKNYELNRPVTQIYRTHRRNKWSRRLIRKNDLTSIIMSFNVVTLNWTTNYESKF